MQQRWITRNKIRGNEVASSWIIPPQLVVPKLSILLLLLLLLLSSGILRVGEAAILTGVSSYILQNGGFESSSSLNPSYPYIGNWNSFNLATLGSSSSSSSSQHAAEGSNCIGPTLETSIFQLEQCVSASTYSEKTIRIQYMYTVFDRCCEVGGINLNLYYSNLTSQSYAVNPSNIPPIDTSNNVNYWKQYDITVKLLPASNGNQPNLCFVFLVDGFYLDNIMVYEDSSIRYEKISNPDFETSTDSLINADTHYRTDPGLTLYQWYNNIESNSYYGEEELYGRVDTYSAIWQCFPASDFMNKKGRIQYMSLQDSSQSQRGFGIGFNTNDNLLVQTVTSSTASYYGKWKQNDYIFDIPNRSSPTPTAICFYFYIEEGQGLDNVILSIDPCSNMVCVDEDSDFCTDFICSGGECIHIDHICEDDGIACTIDSCYEGECHHDSSCKESLNCEDVICSSTSGRCEYTSTCIGDECHTAECIKNQCILSEVCPEDDDPCTIITCGSKGECNIARKDCNDDNICTTDKCSKLRGGCYYEDYNCDDGDYCTFDSCNDKAKDGEQCEHSPVTCDDESYCTEDSCVKTKGCVFTKVKCDDNSVCTVNLCDPKDGDGDPCYFLEKEKCNDGNRCTVDYCDPISGCKNDKIACNDYNVCTIDKCDKFHGCKFTPISCDDNNQCTVDSCDVDLGCQHIRSKEGVCSVSCNSDQECNDNNICTNDKCVKSQCSISKVDCDDANRCTLDSCLELTGCIHTKIGTCSNSGTTSGASRLHDDNKIIFANHFFDRF